MKLEKHHIKLQNIEGNKEEILSTIWNIDKVVEAVSRRGIEIDMGIFHKHNVDPVKQFFKSKGGETLQRLFLLNCEIGMAHTGNIFSNYISESNDLKEVCIVGCSNIRYLDLRSVIQTITNACKKN